ncbi:spermidine synthase family protein, partial [Achromobacter xylosoxidans]
PPAPAVDGPAAREASRLSPQGRLAVALYAVAGAVALGYEVLWSQMIIPFMSTRAFAFSVVLAVYLAGLALGAACYARWGHRFGDPWRVFATLIAGAGLIALAEAALLGLWLVPAQDLAEAGMRRIFDNGLAGMSARFAVAAGAVVLLPTLLLGAAFPAVLQIVAPGERRSRGAGLALAANTLGGIAGTALVAFVLLPWLGTIRSLTLLAATACAVGVAAAWRGRAVAP